MPDEKLEELALSSPPLRENVDPNYALDGANDGPTNQADNVKVDDPSEKTTEEAPSKISFEIDLEDVNGSLDRLFEAQPKIHNIFNTRVGQKATAKHAPRIAELEAETQRLNFQIVQAEIGSMSEEAVKEKLGVDSAFRQRHDSLEDAPTAMEETQRKLRIAATIAGTLDSAVEQGLPTAIGDEIVLEVGAGKFDVNEDGTARTDVEALSAFTARVMSAIRTNTVPVIPASSEETKESSKSVIRDTSSPDMKPGDKVSTNNVSKFTIEQVQAMDPPTKLEHWPKDGDWERAVRNGDISGLSAETVEVAGRI